MYTNTWSFLLWLYNLFLLSLRFLAGGALAGVFAWQVVNRILWECNLPILPYWWYWFLLVTIFILKMLMKKEAFDDAD
jgi:hypothetical protein